MWEMMEAGIKMTYEKAEGGIRVLRCYGKCDIVQIPEQIDGCPVTELGPYVFSSGLEKEPEPGGEPLCGEGLREIFLPDTLKKIGRYAFYNCDGIRKLRIAGTTADIGAGAFNGCRKIQELEVKVTPGEKSCLKEILAELNETLLVKYMTEWMGEQKEARLVFPAFYEEAVENTPARILETHTHGCGHRYRYCFKGSDFQFKDYDALFAYAVVQEEQSVVTDLAIGRLRYPYGLFEDASRRYEAYLEENIVWIGESLIEKDDLDSLIWLVKKYSPRSLQRGSQVPGSCKVHNSYDMGKMLEHASGGISVNEGFAERAREGLCNIGKSALGVAEFGKFIEAANRFRRVEALSFLMDERRRIYKPERKKFQL